MNRYVSLINETVDYIEKNITRALTLEELAEHFYVSAFHFNRIFKIVVGISLKQYILGRKLTQSLERLDHRDAAVIDVAYDFGFEYPEVYSRAFKKQFGISPSVYKKEKNAGVRVEKIAVVERDIINYKGTLVLKESFVYRQAIPLQGRSIEVNRGDESFAVDLNRFGSQFLTEIGQYEGLDHNCFFTIVNCHGCEDEGYTVFYGKQTESNNFDQRLTVRIIPEGWYMSFTYRGDMFNIGETFEEDLYRLIMIKEIEIKPIGIGMINIYRADYFQTNAVEILIPVKKRL